jgi:endonuclease/exonuclease/phosphatase family metal-dependent hydrolase
MAGRLSMDWFRVSTLRRLALPALVTVLGLQSLRVYYPSLAWYLRDTVGVGSITLGGIAFATFLLGFAAPLVRRAFGSRGALWFSGGGLAGLRLLEQFSTDPALDLYLSLASVALFLIFLSTFIGHSRAADGPAGPYRIAGGIVVGLALDTLIKGAAGTLDLSWTPAIGAAVVVLAMAALTLWLIAVEPTPLRTAPSDVSWSHALPLIGLGSFFLIEALIALNQGWVAQLSGIPSTTAFAVLLLGILAMAAGASMAFARPSLHRLPVAALAGLLVFLAVPRTVQLAAYLPFVIVLIQFTLGWGLGLIALRGVEPIRTGLGHTSVAVSLGMLIYLLLAFVYYVSFDIALPLPRGWVVPLASLIYAACMIGAVGGTPGRVTQRDLTAVAATGALAALGILIALLLPTSAPSPDASAPTGRVMTFNIHSAFNRDGRLDPEAIARVISARHPDVVALQEVSRGWLIDGSVDLVDWLARRLGMEVVFAGTADPIWGNAILSRVGFLDHGSGSLPAAETLLPRGYVWAHVDLGLEEPVLVVATHLHHIAEEPGPRLAQIPVLLDFWGAANHTVLMGDLNAEPTWPEMELILNAGMVDAWSEAGQGPGLTWPADDPFQRIDWIWLSPDLQAIAIETVDSTVSDHRAVVADLADR